MEMENGTYPLIACPSLRNEFGELVWAGVPDPWCGPVQPTGGLLKRLTGQRASGRQRAPANVASRRMKGIRQTRSYHCALYAASDARRGQQPCCVIPLCCIFVSLNLKS
jgi:hypothetical protein